jgi:hypothetical protein
MEWDNVEVRKIKSYKSDSTDYQLRIGVINKGKLPTALKQAHLVKIVRDDRIELKFDTAGYQKEKPGYRIIEEKKAPPVRTGRGMGMGPDEPSQQNAISKNIPFTEGGSVTEAVFTIRLTGRKELKGKTSMFSTRGGILRDKEFIIK